PGLINLDFADVKTIMLDTGLAHMGIGRGTGENKAEEAARQAISSPLLETSIEGARGVLLNITGGADLGLQEVNLAAGLIQASADPEANIIFGAVIDDNLKDELIITVIATGFNKGAEIKRPGHLFAIDGNKKVAEQPAVKKTVVVEEDADGPEIPTFLKRKGFR
ncbi:MAG: cell division protein FtsZ, partial [Clostridia bacterium]|nr:cell division protein FtsZ [Clostridia bacterium]